MTFLNFKNIENGIFANFFIKTAEKGSKFTVLKSVARHFFRKQILIPRIKTHNYSFIN